MAEHKFKIGQTVTVLPQARQATPPGKYTIVRQLPSVGSDNQYRVKAKTDSYERMVRESELSGSGG